MVTPDKEADHSDRDAGPGDELVPEDAFAGEARNDLADDAEPWKNHDVNSGMRVEPEQVLEQQRVSMDRGVENADAKESFHAKQQQVDREYRGGQHVQHTRGVERPAEYRHLVPVHSWRPQAVDCDNEVEACSDRGETGKDDSGEH